MKTSSSSHPDRPTEPASPPAGEPAGATGSDEVNTLGVNTEAGEENVGARLILETGKTIASAQGVFVNDGSWHGPFRFVLTARRIGESARAKTSRSGTFSIAPGEASILTKVPISVREGDSLVLKLEVFKDGKLISEDHIQRRHPP